MKEQCELFSFLPVVAPNFSLMSRQLRLRVLNLAWYLPSSGFIYVPFSIIGLGVITPPATQRYHTKEIILKRKDAEDVLSEMQYNKIQLLIIVNMRLIFTEIYFKKKFFIIFLEITYPN